MTGARDRGEIEAVRAVKGLAHEPPSFSVSLWQPTQSVRRIVRRGDRRIEDRSPDGFQRTQGPRKRPLQTQGPTQCAGSWLET